MWFTKNAMEWIGDTVNHYNKETWLINNGNIATSMVDSFVIKLSVMMLACWWWFYVLRMIAHIRNCLPTLHRCSTHVCYCCCRRHCCCCCCCCCYYCMKSATAWMLLLLLLLPLTVPLHKCYCCCWCTNSAAACLLLVVVTIACLLSMLP